MQFAGGLAQASEEQNHGRGRPRNFLAAVWQGLFQEFVQCQSTQQLFPQPRTAEFPAALHPHPLHIDFYPFWLCRVEQIRLITRAFLRAALHAQTALFVHHPQPRYDALPRTSLRTIAFHQRPIGVPFAIFATKATSQIHAAMLRFQQTKARGLVVTTCTFRRQTTPFHNTQPQTKELAVLPRMRLCSNNFRIIQNCGRSASGHFKINPVFDDALPVSHGLAAIKVGEKWGFLYTNGHQVILPKYTAAYYFRIGEHCWKSDLGTIGGCSRPSPAPRLVRRSQHKELRRYTGGRERKDCGRCTKLSVPDAKEKQREAFLASLRLLRLLRLLQRTFDAKRLPQGWLGLTWFLFC